VPAQGIDDAIGHEAGLLRTGLRKENPELVSSEPGQDIGLSHTTIQRIGHSPEQKVARFVSEGVVDLLEMVQIDEKQSTR
jgi:hypothetical protein